MIDYPLEIKIEPYDGDDAAQNKVHAEKSTLARKLESIINDEVGANGSRTFLYSELSAEVGAHEDEFAPMLKSVGGLKTGIRIAKG